MTRPLVLAAALLCLPLASAQETTVPGRQVIEDNDVLLEVRYTSQRVRLRLFDLDGEPLPLRDLWLRRCDVTIEVERDGGFQRRSSRVVLVEPADGSLPYLEARHQLGALQDQERVTVFVHLKNVAGRGDRTERFTVVWQRCDGFACAAPSCRAPESACALCRHRLCAPAPAPADRSVGPARRLPSTPDRRAR